MQYGVLGTGIVGQTIGTALIKLGHDVKMGSRQAGNPKALTWVNTSGSRSSEGSFGEAAAFGNVIINATAGAAALDVAAAVGSSADYKTLVDVSNPLDFSAGFPPSLSVGNTDSVGEQLQRSLPNVRVVKTLNTMNAGAMVQPNFVFEHHNVFINGNDPNAKSEVRSLLMSFGWPHDDIIDLGDITASRAVEAYVMLWTRLFQTLATPAFNIKIVKA